MNVFNLSTDLLASLFGDWTNCKSIANFDSAICSKSYRNNFLDVVKEDSFQINNASVPLTKSMLKWLNMREMRISDVHFESETIGNFDRYFKLLTKPIKTCVSRSSNGDFLNFISLFHGDIYHLDLSEEGIDIPHRISDKNLETILQMVHGVKHLTLRYCHELTNKSVVTIGSFFPKLESFYFCGGKFTKKVFSIISKHLSELSAIEFCSMGATGADFNTFIQTSSTLSKIIMKECDNLKQDFFCTLADQLINLTHLEVTYGVGFNDLCATRFLARAPNLSYLYLYKCDISDDTMRSISASGACLRELHLKACFRISDGGISSIAPTCCKLTAFTLSPSPLISDMGVMVLSKHCILLRSVDFADCPKLTNISAHLLFERCKNLTDFNFHGSKITVTGLCDALFDTNVQSVKICDGSSFEDEFDISRTVNQEKHSVEFYNLKQNHFHEILKKVALCAQLRFLQVASEHIFNDKHFLEIVRGCPLLEHLDIVARGVTVRSFTHITAHCQLLNYFNVSDVVDVDDTALALFLDVVPRLRYLGLKGCLSLTDTSIGSIATKCPNIVMLDISDLPLITDPCVTLMAQECMLLRVLNTEHCAKLTRTNYLPADR